MGNTNPSEKRPCSPMDALALGKPTRLTAQLRAYWPQVQKALADGHTLRLIHKHLNTAGIPISYKALSLYRRRLERRQKGPAPSVSPNTPRRPNLRTASRVSIPWPIFTHKKKRNGRPGSVPQALPTKASSSKEGKFNTTMPMGLEGNR